MPLESCMIVLDNSEYMRNGDYTPTRFQAQAQAASNIFTTKADSNPESAVGVMTMAGKSPSLLVTPTNDFGKLLSAMNKAAIGGVCSLITAIQVAQLALKHRENKNQRQRVIVFVGSPIDDSQEELVKLGKRLRKNNVAIDVITFGEEGLDNDPKVSALIEASATDESHLVSVPPGGNQLLTDVIARSPILWDRTDAPPPTDGDAGMGDMDLAELEAADPELAMALRMSLQEEQERLARSQPSSSSAPSTSVEQGLAPQPVPEPIEPEVSNATALPASITNPLHNANDARIPAVPGDEGMDVEGEGEDEEDEEEMLRRAMALSRGENPDDEDVLMGEDEEEDEDAAIARAIAMSLEESKKQDDKATKE